jgi:hypothetical protein
LLALTLVCGKAIPSSAVTVGERLAPCLACHGETRLYRPFVMLAKAAPKASQTSRVKRQKNYFAAQ